MSASSADSGGLTGSLDPTRDTTHVISRLGITPVPTTTGDYAMEMPVNDSVSNDRGGLQGGLLATLIDVVAGITSMRGQPRDLSAATSDMHIHFLSAVRVGPARAEATVVRRGKRTIVIKIDVHDVGREVLCAIATATFHVIELRPDQIRRRGLEAPG